MTNSVDPDLNVSLEAMFVQTFVLIIFPIFFSDFCGNLDQAQIFYRTAHAFIFSGLFPIENLSRNFLNVLFFNKDKGKGFP